MTQAAAPGRSGSMDMSKYMYIGAWAYEEIIYLYEVEALEVL